MREAGRISGNSFNEIIRRGLRTEKDIEATLEYLFRISGCEKPAYVPVVAGGSVIHLPEIDIQSNPIKLFGW
jgi:intermediate cleaving peptidase 55